MKVQVIDSTKDKTYWISEHFCLTPSYGRRFSLFLLSRPQQYLFTEKTSSTAAYTGKNGEGRNLLCKSQPYLDSVKQQKQRWWRECWWCYIYIFLRSRVVTASFGKPNRARCTSTNVLLYQRNNCVLSFTFSTTTFFIQPNIFLYTRIPCTFHTSLSGVV